MRDTAKWIVGGIVATAASVFAGSSLTSLGSLDPATDLSRLVIAAAAIVVGFWGLGLIVQPAMKVLTIQSTSFEQLATEARTNPGGPAAALEAKYKAELGGRTLAGLIAAAEDPSAPPELRSSTLFSALPEEANFEAVRTSYLALQGRLVPGVALTALGFGVFA